METIKLFDSFAGIGALHKALKNIEVRVELVGMSEIDIEAIRAYNAIHFNTSWEEIETPSREEMEKFLLERNIGLDFKTGKCKLPKGDKLKEVYKICKALNNFGDISLIKPENLPNFDLFNFSFPCTDISVAGKQKGLIDEEGNLTRSGLYVYGMDIIKVKKPKYVMIENVRNLVSNKFKYYFDNMLQELDEIGYNTYWKVLNAKDYGIPQNRERVFVICIRKDVDNKQFKFPQPFDNGIRLKDVLDREVDKKYYIEDARVQELISQVKGDKLGELPKEMDKVTVTYALGSREHRGYGWQEICPTLCARDYKDSKVLAIPNTRCLQVGNLTGGKWDKINESCRRVYSTEGCSPTIHTCGGGNTEPKVVLKKVSNPIICEHRRDEGLRFFKDNVCGTIRTIDAGGDKRIIESVNDYIIRKLTPTECYRLMGFSDIDIQRVIGIGMSDTQMYKQAGNSIVVNVLEEILKNLFC